MRHPWHIWLAFGLCLAVALAALGWISAKVVELDRAQTEAQRSAAIEENVRLALWRMDSALGPLLAQENARPYFAYGAFYPLERAYTSMFAELQKGDVLIPSPLLVQVSPYILLHFQFGPDGALTSPQVPTGNMRDLAETGYTTSEAIIAAGKRLDEFKTLVTRAALLKVLRPEKKRRESAFAPPGVPALFAAWLAGQAVAQPAPERPDQQAQRNVDEWKARQQSIDQFRSQENIQKGARGRDVSEGALRPVWFGEALVLARCISVNGQDYVQGCWLDWPAIRGWLLAEARDLLPRAELVAARGAQSGGQAVSGAEWIRHDSGSAGGYNSTDERSRMLAALPVRLVPGRIPAAPADGLSPIGLSLVIAWACVLVAAAAIAVLLRGAIVLSERRGAFVSAVTHEMRTPLTTFRMYTEMLAGGMVPESKRRGYLETLQTEADRLGHLVENVLAYARLERGSAKGRSQVIGVRELLGGMRDRLAQRAEQAEMALVVEGGESGDALCVRAEQADMALLVESGEPGDALSVRADPSAVEQILFNLVDNACKYAACAEQRTIHVEAGLAAGGFVRLSVRDHGPGISAAEARGLFRPFQKSARDAANSAPGVGLGLALSRRLARSMGGELVLEADSGGGARFTLSLPAVR